MIASQLAQAREFEALDLIEQVDLFRLDANRQLDSRRKVELGQFMTPPPIARLMASMLDCDTSEVSLLDAGAGVGSLLGAAVVALSSRNQPPKSIHVTAYELEPIMIAYLRDTLQLCAELCDRMGVAFNSEIIAADFIAHTVDLLANPMFEQSRAEYSCAILNPPYRKIQTASATRRQLSRIGIETSNLYTGFLALAAHLLAKDGELVAITPRSYCNGPYFRPFREFFLQTMALRQFHLFDSRQRVFRHDQVLQENIIVSARKSQMRSHTVLITSSIDSEDEMPTMHEMPYTDVVHPSDPQLFIHLLADQVNAQVARRAATLSARLVDLSLEISTGRVVDFRASLFLRSEPTSDTAPLLYPAHMISGRIEWPKPTSKKPNALVLCDETKALFVPNEYYVLVKRFSSKEERRRVVAAVYDPTDIPGSVVGFENHLNYFHHAGRGFDATLARGLAAFLNSTLVDDYFRQFSGHTQVNATDLRMMHYPTHAQLLALGKRIESAFLTQEDLDELVAQECVAMGEVSGLDAIHRKQRIKEALAILRELDFPRAQQNERSALTLLALLNLTPEMPWAAASDPLRGITPMMEFFALHYGKQYKPNTRETVRRQTVHQFLDAGLIVANPDNVERPINSPKAVYQIDQATLDLLRTYGTNQYQWEQHRRTYLASAATLQQKYSQAREMQRIPVTLHSGVSFKLSPGGQNVLVKQIVDEFAKRFTPGGEVLYIGDTDEKFAFLPRIGCAHSVSQSTLMGNARCDYLSHRQAMASAD